MTTKLEALKALDVLHTYAIRTHPTMMKQHNDEMDKNMWLVIDALQPPPADQEPYGYHVSHPAGSGIFTRSKKVAYAQRTNYNGEWSVVPLYTFPPDIDKDLKDLIVSEVKEVYKNRVAELEALLRDLKGGFEELVDGRHYQSGVAKFGPATYARICAALKGGHGKAKG